MKRNIEIAALRRRIRRIEEDWANLLKRIASSTPEERKLAIRIYEYALQQDRAKLVHLLSLDN
jgi:hypothetical protein